MILFQIDAKVFVLNNPRSGSTLLRLLLNSNRQVVSPSKCGFLHYFFKRYKDWNLIDLKTEKLNIFLDHFCSTKINTWKSKLKISPYEHKKEVRIKITDDKRFLSKKYFQIKDYFNAFKTCFNALKNNPF
jgi:hypothetical protein